MRVGFDVVQSGILLLIPNMISYILLDVFFRIYTNSFKTNFISVFVKVVK